MAYKNKKLWFRIWKFKVYIKYYFLRKRCKSYM